MDMSTQISKQQKRYIDKGAKAGKNALPPTNAYPFDVNENQLIAEVKGFSEENYRQYRTFVGTKGKALANIENELSSLSPTCEAVLGNQDLSFTVDQAMAVERSNLVKLATKVLTLRSEVRAFRIMNNITESAVYPENPIDPYLWILPLLLLETLIGAFCYDNASGLIGGAGAAFIMSLANLILAFTAGALFRYKNLKNPGHKMIGWAALLISFFAGLYINSLFASYRAQYQLLTDPLDLLQQRDAFYISSDSAIHVFLLKSPISDFSSFMLFTLGLVSFFIAFYKGLHVCDRYPGYGPHVRRLKIAEDTFEIHSQGVRGRIQDEINRQKETLAKSKSDLMQMQPAVEQVKLALSNEHREMRSQQKNLNNAFTLVLMAYRETNVAVRPTQPPAYFGQIPDLVEQAMSDAGEELSATISEIETRIAILKERYQSLLTDALSEMGNQSKQLLGDTYAKFLADIIIQAGNDIDNDNFVAPQMKVAA